jgi:hypothetical protein
MGEQVVSGPHKAPGTPGGEPGTLDKDEQQPLGDAILPLLLMAAAFCLIRRKEII